MASASLSGHCLCGAVTITVKGSHDPRLGACHCRMCQRWSGGLFLCFAAHDLEVTGPVRVYPSSAFAERAFCSICGSHLWMRDTAEGETRVDLMPGLFDAAVDWPMRSEIYVDRRLRAIDLAGDHRRATRAEYESRNSFVKGDSP